MRENDQKAIHEYQLLFNFQYEGTETVRKGREYLRNTRSVLIHLTSVRTCELYRRPLRWNIFIR